MGAQAMGGFRDPVHGLDEAVADPQVQHNDMVMEIAHRTLGRFRTIGIPVKLSETPGRLRLPPPELGEHTDDVLTEAAYSREDIGRLRAEGVV